MSQTSPTSITALPAAPSTATPSTFATLADAFVAALATFVSQVNAAATNVYNNAVDCFTNATAAATSATSAAASATSAAAYAGAIAWVNGGTYALNAAAISGVDHQTYRKITASSATVTDPSADATNWVKITGGDSAWVRKTTTYVFVSGDRVKTSTTLAGWTGTFPASPSDGDQISIYDVDKTFNTHNLTLLPNGSGRTIQGYSTSCILDIKGFDGVFKYDSTNNDWSV